ncbi:polycomb group RING finger protein 1 [Pyxicephalus adspersus]|uniref:polycomb group RING finger protein 1 n=1 Tax=Pyxicephalus adspersus TaxID=30357 RepID=UPI003B59F8B6
MAASGDTMIAMRLRNQLQSVYKMDPLRNEVPPHPHLPLYTPACLLPIQLLVYYLPIPPCADPVVDVTRQSLSAVVSQGTSHYYKNDEHVSLCLEKVGSAKDKKKFILQQKYVRCSVRTEIRHVRRVLCHRLGVPSTQVSNSLRDLD